MESLRVHTFFLDIRGIKKLKSEAIYDFIAEQLLLTASDVVAIQIDLADSKVYVETQNQEKAEETVSRFDGKKELVSNGERHRIRLQIEDGGTDVKLYHLPPRMKNEWIEEYMRDFGTVLNIRNETCRSEKFPGIPNGVRIIRMRLKKQIPSFISVRGYSTYVTYQNQLHTCRHCGNAVHYGISCAENRNNHASGLSSYANAVADKSRDGTSRSSQPTTPGQTQPIKISSTEYPHKRTLSESISLENRNSLQSTLSSYANVLADKSRDGLLRPPQSVTQGLTQPIKLSSKDYQHKRASSESITLETPKKEKAPRNQSETNTNVAKETIDLPSSSSTQMNQMSRMVKSTVHKDNESNLMEISDDERSKDRETRSSTRLSSKPRTQSK